MKAMSSGPDGTAKDYTPRSDLGCGDWHGLSINGVDGQTVAGIVRGPPATLAIHEGDRNDLEKLVVRAGLDPPTAEYESLAIVDQLIHSIAAFRRSSGITCE